MRVVHRSLSVTLAAGVVAVVGLVAVDAQRPAPVPASGPAAADAGDPEGLSAGDAGAAARSPPTATG